MKIFCIGYNKTGTSSLDVFMKNHKFIGPNDDIFSHNLESYFSKNYNTFEYMIKNRYDKCNWFQDVPFSLPNMYRFIDVSFPNSKFILTVRSSDEEWFNSLVRFHKKIFSNIYHSPSENNYIYKGWLYDYLTIGLGSPKHDPYNKEYLIKSYNNHINDVKEYFKNTDKLFIMNLKENKIKELCDFLDIKTVSNKFPHINKS